MRPPQTESFLWYDLETSGTDPSSDRIMQFAAQRTDLELNEIDDPIAWYVRLSPDILPNPGSCLVTGLTPQHVNRVGIEEWQAFVRIRDILDQPGTCIVGYNNVRFDDVFLRYGFYRNLMDPYAHEWQGGNSRWDLIDVARAISALRPGGMRWPRYANDVPSYRLEDLTAANGIAHDSSHDALSDVRALIGLARALRDAQPQLWRYAFEHADKRSVRDALLPLGKNPCIHASRRYPNTRHCAAPVASVAVHPDMDTRVIVADLSADLEPLLHEDAQTLRARIGSGDPESRPPLNEVVLNRCPFVAPLSVVRPEDAERLGFSLKDVHENHRLLTQTEGLTEKIRAAYRSSRGSFEADDVEKALYDGFIPDIDRDAMQHVQDALQAGDPWPAQRSFQDPRLDSLAVRLKARLRPDELEGEEAAAWQRHVKHCLAEGFGSRLSLFEYHQCVAELRAQATEGDAAILDQLEAYDPS